MNRHVKMSAILIVLVLALSMVFVSCDELENAVIELETKIDETFQTSIDTAKTDLETAKGELKALIESGDAVSAQALTAAIEALNAAIDEAEKAAADANAADKAALETAIAAAKAEAVESAKALVDAAKTELNATIEANKAGAAADLEAAVATLNAAVKTANKVAADANAADKAALEQAIATAKTEAAAAIEAVKAELIAKVDTAVAALNAADTKNAGDLAQAILDLNTAIEDAKSVAALADTSLTNKIETADKALDEAIKALDKKVDDAVAELKAADLTKVNLADYTAKIKDLENAIAELAGVDGALDDTYATDLDVDSKIEAAVAALQTAIDGLQSALNNKTDDLQKQINDNKDLSQSNLSAKADELVALIQTAQAAADAAQATADKAAEDAAKALEDAVAELKALIEESKTTAQNAYVALEKWDDATAKVEAALAQIKALRDSYNPVLYKDDYATILKNYDVAWILVIRATNADAVDKAVADYSTYLSGLRTLGEVVYDELTKLAATVDDVRCTENVRTTLETIRAQLDAALAEGNVDVSANILTFVNADGETVDLDALCNAYIAKYNEIKAAGEDIMADMNAVVAVPHLSLTLKAGNEAIDSAYAAWLADGNEVAEIAGFEAAKVAYDEKKAKIADYEARGNALKAEIDAWLANNNPIVLSKTHSETIDALIAKYNAWNEEGNNDSVAYIDGLADSKVALDAADDRIEEIIAEGLAFKSEMITFNNKTTCLTLEAVAADLDARFAVWVAVNDKTMVDGLVDTETAYEAKKGNVAELRAEGETLLADINEELNKGLVVLAHQQSVSDLLTRYNAWAGAHTASVALIDGLTDAKASLDAKQARIIELGNAKIAADNINMQIDAIILVNTGDATKPVKDKLADIGNQITTWINIYKLGTAEELDQDNYNMVHHQDLADKLAKFDELVGEFERTFAEFKAAYEKVGEINLLSGDELAAAREAFDAWRIAASLGTFDYELSDGAKPSEYTVSMYQKEAEFAELVANALAAYIEKFDPAFTDATVTLYDEAKIALIEGWYAEFAVKDENGAYVFETGYVLSETVTVTADDYAKVVEIRAAYEKLVADKKVETANVNALIANLGTITTASRDDIDAAYAAYAAWLAGTNVDGYNALQFAIDLDKDIDDALDLVDKAALDAANSACEPLEDMAAALKALGESIPKYTVSTDFADPAACEEYFESLKNFTIEETAFMNANNGSTVYDWDGDGDRDADDATWYANNVNAFKAAVLAVLRYKEVMKLDAQAAGWAEGDFVAAVETVLADATEAIDQTAQDDLSTVAKKYSDKLTALQAFQAEYQNAMSTAATNTAEVNDAIEAILDAALADMVADENDAATAEAAYLVADAKFDDLVALGYAAYVALENADYDVADVAIKAVLEGAIDDIKVEANDDVVVLATYRFDAIVEVGNDALACEAVVDAAAYETVKVVCNAAIETIKTADATGVDSAKALVNAKYDSIKTVYAKYVEAQAEIPAEDTINLGAVANVFGDYLNDIERVATEHEVTNATTASEELFLLIVADAKA